MSWEEMLRHEQAEKLLMEALEATPMEVVTVPKGDVLLDCGHMLHFDTAIPHKKESLWCHKCRAERHPEAIGTGKAYRVKCETCNYTRGKSGRLDADTSAVRHREKRRHHVVNVLDSAGNTVYTFQDSGAVLTLPDEPPF